VECGIIKLQDLEVSKHKKRWLNKLQDLGSVQAQRWRLLVAHDKHLSMLRDLAVVVE